jgi:hypothetical protein
VREAIWPSALVGGAECPRKLAKTDPKAFVTLLAKTMPTVGLPATRTTP